MRWKTKFFRDIDFNDLELEQRSCVAEVQHNPESAFLLVSEPKPTYTFGRSSQASDLLFSKEILSQRGISVRPVSRGGQWTYHGPGQIVIYPVVSLRALGYRERAVAGFLCDLRRGVMNFLISVGVSPETGEKPFGVFVNEKKLVSFGIAVQRGVVSHGLALYKDRQTEIFSGIHPCGVLQGQVTSVEEELKNKLDWHATATSIAKQIKAGFNT